MAGNILVELKAGIGEFKTKMGEAKTEIDGLEKKGASTGDKMKGLGPLLAAGIGGGVLEGVNIAIGAANKLEDAHATLETAVKNANLSWESNKKSIEQADKAGEKYNFTNAETEEALARSVTSTGSVTKSQGLLGTAMDLSRFKHIDLATAMDAVDKAATGNLKPLKALGIDVPIHTANALKLQQANDKLTAAQEKLNGMTDAGGKSHAAYIKQQEAVAKAQKSVNDETSAGGDIIGALNSRIGGQAATAAATFSGKMEHLKVMMEDVAAKVGEKLIPIILKLVDWLGKIGEKVQAVTSWFNDHKEVAIALGIGIAAVLVPAVVAYAVAMASAAAATIIAAAPILAIIAVVALLALGIIELWKHWKDIWEWIKGAVSAAWDFIKGAFNSGLDFIKSIPGKITSFASTMWDSIKDAMTAAKDWISEKVGDVIQFFRDLPGKLADAAGDVFRFIKDKATEAKNWLHDKIWDVIGFFQDLPGKLVNAAGDVFRFLKDKATDAKNWLHDRIWDVIGFFQDLPGKIGSAVSGVFDGLKNAFKSAINWIIDKWNGLEFTVPGVHQSIFGKEVGFDGFTIGTPNISHLAAGGPINGLALVGERGPELFAGQGTIIPNHKLGGGGNNYTINVYAFDTQDAGQAAVKAIQDYERSNGAGWRAA